MSTADRYMKRWITVPDGRRFAGRIPGRSAVTLTEHRLRDELAEKLGGATEVSLPYGRADVMTETAVFEVEPFHSWKKGMHQALAYSAQTGLPPALALFGNAKEEDVLRVFNKIWSGRPRAALWWYTGHSWAEISCASKCRAMKAPPSRTSTALSDEDKSNRGRAAAHAMHAKHDAKALMDKTRATFMQRFLDEVDPDRLLPEDERERRAYHARKAHFAGLAYRSAKVRAERSEQKSP